MAPRRLLPLALAVLFCGLSAPVWAQTPEAAAEEPLVRVVLTDGSTLIGTVEGATETTIAFRTTSGVAMTIPRDRIEAIEELSGRIVDGAYRRLDPNRTRLFFAPTARPLGSGQGYFATYEIFLPFVAAGVGDAVSLAGGISLLPGSPGQAVYVAPKVTFVNTPQVSLAAGVFAGTVVGGEGAGEGYGGVAFGLGTFGGPERAVTLGAGFAFAGGDGESEASRPLLLVGGEYQVSNSIKLLSENYVFTGEGATLVLSGGIRFFNETLAADLGLITTPEAFELGGFPFLPWIGFAYNFGW